MKASGTQPSHWASILTLQGHQGKPTSMASSLFSIWMLVPPAEAKQDPFHVQRGMLALQRKGVLRMETLGQP